MSPTYATSEESRQSGAPLELYRLRVGGTRGRPAAPPASGVVEVFRDEFEYADTAALLAAWTFSQNGFPASECVLDPTGGVAGTKALRINVPAGGQDSHIGPHARRRLTGLAPNIWHDLTIKPKLDAAFGTDPLTPFYAILGLRAEPGDVGTTYAVELVPFPPWNTYVTATARGKTTAAGTLDVFFGWAFLSYFLVQQSHSLWWDTLVVTRPEVIEGDAGEDPTDGVVSHFTSADVDVVYAGDTYESGIIVRNNLTAGGNEASAGNIELRVPRTHPIAALAGGPPNPPVTLELIRLHRADLTQAVTPWRGQVVRRRFEGASCILVCAGIGSLLQRKLPRRLTQRMCHHILGDSLCQIRLADFTTGLLTVSAIDGNVVTVTGAGAAAGAIPTRFANGVLTFGMIKGRIESADGDDLTLRQEIPTLLVGSEVTLTAGCDNQIGTCKNLFDNAGHFGGERVLPVRNPGAGAGIGASSA